MGDRERKSVCLSALLWSVCVDPSWQKDLGVKELYNMGSGRCVNTQAFSFLDMVRGSPIVHQPNGRRFLRSDVIKLMNKNCLW